MIMLCLWFGELGATQFKLKKTGKATICIIVSKYARVKKKEEDQWAV